MESIPANEARDRLEEIVKKVNDDRRPLRIQGKMAGVVVLGEEDWRDLEATLHLSEIPGMKNSIIEGMNTPVEHCSVSPLR